ncbi:hypothetical protein [Niallia sp. 03190]|uniref:hypothetical protein n=1 Tax=Niallia sp. 03190 TaxID=3458061 RepID=UPI0040442BC5
MPDNVVIGRVSAIYPEDNTAKVFREDLGSVTGELIILDRGDDWFPIVGQDVLCVFRSGNSNGYILGGI